MPTFRASPIRIGAAALILIGILGIAIALALSGNDARARGDTPSGATPSADTSAGPSQASPVTTTGTADSTATIDGRIAFWEARVAANATDYSSTLALIDAYLSRVRATGDLSDITRAESALDRARSLAPVNDIGLTLREGFVAFTSHQFVEARDAAQDVLQRDPGNESAVALFGDASIELGDEETARRAYDELEPLGTAPVKLRIARFEQLTGDLEAAEATMRSAIATAETEGFPDQVAAYHLQLAELLRGENRLDEAADEYLAVLEALPKHAAAQGGLARVREAQGNRGEAIDLLERATEAYPTPQLVAALGDLYALDGDDDRASRSYALVERIAAVAQATGGVYDRQLVMFLADHDLRNDDAVALAEAELATRKDVYGHDVYAWALFKAGRFDEADVEAKEAMRLGTQDGLILYHAGMIAAALGRDDEARSLLEGAEMHAAALPPLQLPVLREALDGLGG